MQKFSIPYIYFVIAETREDPPITTDPPTWTEHADVTCLKVHGKTTHTGVAAGCERDLKCPAYAFTSGTKGVRCKGEIKYGDGTDNEETGMKGLKASEGKKVFIRGRYKVDIILDFHQLNKTRLFWKNLIIVSYLSDTCSDGIKNQDEEGIDCDGAACPSCALKNSKYINHLYLLKWQWSLKFIEDVYKIPRHL